MNFADLIAPVEPERFMADCAGRQPLHIPAPQGSRRHELLSWERFNGLLAIRSHWIEANLKLVLNSQAVDAAFYMEEVGTGRGKELRASPAKVDLFLGMGASLVANSVHEISPEVREAGHALAAPFAGLMGTNAYCSFRGIQAFASHYDISEIFALQCEGEKTWRVYENREPEPLDAPPPGPEGQRWIDARKGRVMMEVTTRQGDMLYIPRGFYHDALAREGASLHLTYSVTPHSGRLLFRLLEEEAMRDPAFRAYLPDGRADGGERLRRRLGELAGRLTAIVEGCAFAEEIAARQRKLVLPDHRFALPRRPALDWYAATGRPAEAVRRQDGWVLRSGGSETPLGAAGPAAAWALTRPAFSLHEAMAQFPELGEEGARGLVETLRRAGLYAPCDPPAV